MNTKNNKSDKVMLSVISFIIYVVSVFVICHIYKFYDVEAGIELTEAMDLGMQNIFTNPLDFKFIGVQYTFSIGVVFLLGTYMMFLDMDKKSKLRVGKEKGTAKWNTDIKKYNKQYTSPKGKVSTTGADNMILGQTTYLSMNTRQTMRNNNVLVIGGSGSGKSRFVVKPNILQSNCSFVITDPKGELLESMGDFLEKQGYKIKVFNLVQMAHSNCYNPFHYIRDENGVLTMITALIKNTTPKGASKGDPFWEKSEIALLQAICFYLYYEMPPSERNFANVSKMLEAGRLNNEDASNQTPLDYIFDELKERNPEHIAVRQYAIFKQASGKTAMSILVSAAVRLTVFNLQSVKNLTSIDNIELGKFGDEKTALFCITPATDTTFNFLVALLYNQIFETLYYHAEYECKGRRLPIHVRFLLDEFANIGTIPEFEQKLATMRSYEISCTIILQNLAQLKTMYKDSWESITGNCDTFIFLGGQEQTTLEYVSKKLGKETITTKNSSRTRGRSGSTSTSFNSDGRELMTPDEIARMDNKNCIIFIRGILPFFDKKYNYPKHKNYKLTGDASDDAMFIVSQRFHTSPNNDIYIENIDMLKKEAQSSERDVLIIDDETKIRTRTEGNLETFVRKDVNEEFLAELGIYDEEDIEETLEIEEIFNPEHEFGDSELFDSDFFR